MSSFVRWASGFLALVLLLSTTVSAEVIYSAPNGAVPGESSSAKTSVPPASSWVDDCDSTASPYVVYQNLQPSDHLADLSGFPSLPDTTGLTVTHPEYPGRAIYSVGGRSSVTLTLFSHDGTFATQGENGWERGGDGDALADPQRLYYDRQSSRIFLPDAQGDLTYCYMKKLANYGFFPLQGTLSRDEWYGLNLSYSLDGTRFLPIAPSSCKITRYDSSSLGMHLFQEEYSLTLPSGSSYLQVELREVPSVPSVQNKDGQWVETGSEPNHPSTYLILTSTQLHGGSDSSPLPSPLPEEEEDEEEDKKGSTSSRSSSGSSTTTNNTTTSTETVDNRSTSQTTTTNNNTTTVINNYYFFTPEALSYLEQMDLSPLTLGDSGLAYVIGSSAAASQSPPAPSASAALSLPPQTYLLLTGGCILFLLAVLFKQSR